jgi:hypothetical protein
MTLYQVLHELQIALAVIPGTCSPPGQAEGSRRMACAVRLVGFGRGGTGSSEQ